MEQKIYNIGFNGDTIVDDRGEKFTIEKSYRINKGVATLINEKYNLAIIITSEYNLYTCVRQTIKNIHFNNINQRCSQILDNVDEYLYWLVQCEHIEGSFTVEEQHQIKKDKIQELGSKFKILNDSFISEEQRNQDKASGIFKVKNDKEFNNKDGKSSETTSYGLSTNYIPENYGVENISLEMILRKMKIKSLENSERMNKLFKDGYFIQDVYLGDEYAVVTKKVENGGEYKTVFRYKRLEDIDNKKPKTKEETLSQWQENYTKTGSLFFPNTEL